MKTLSETMQYVKNYTYDWTGENLVRQYKNQITIQMHNDYQIMQTGKSCFPRDDIKKWLHKLMAEYSPTATDENVMKHMYFNTVRFGDSQMEVFSDYIQVQILQSSQKNTLSDEWEYIDGLPDPYMLWMFGEDAKL